jgi:hypothetical protein
VTILLGALNFSSVDNGCSNLNSLFFSVPSSLNLSLFLLLVLHPFVLLGISNIALVWALPRGICQLARIDAEARDKELVVKGFKDAGCKVAG